MLEGAFTSARGVTAYRPGSSAFILTHFDKLHNPSNKKNALIGYIIGYMDCVL